MEEIGELRMTVKDGSLDTMREVFDYCALAIEEAAVVEAENSDISVDWQVDQENLEGIRLRFGGVGSGQFFMLRKSLHDPIISLQIEGRSVEEVRETVMKPLIQVLQSWPQIRNQLDMTVLREY